MERIEMNTLQISGIVLKNQVESVFQCGIEEDGKLCSLFLSRPL